MTINLILDVKKKIEIPSLTDSHDGRVRQLGSVSPNRTNSVVYQPVEHVNLVTVYAQIIADFCCKGETVRAFRLKWISFRSRIVVVDSCSTKDMFL